MNFLPSRCKNAVVAIGIVMALHVISILFDFSELSLIGRAMRQEASMDQLQASDARQAILGIALLVGFVFSVVAYLMWLHLATTNLRVLGLTNAKFTPGWAVGYYFVPLVNLAYGYEAVAEVWRGTFAPPSPNLAAWKIRKPSPIVGFWWAAWIVGGLLARIGFSVAKDPGDISDLSTAAWLSIAASLCVLLAGYLLTQIVKRVSEGQTVAFQRLQEAHTQ